VDAGNQTSLTLNISTPGTATYYFAVSAYTIDFTSDSSLQVSTIVSSPLPHPVLEIDYPSASQVLPPDTVLSGWAADLGAPAGTGTGIDAIHVYAFPAGKPAVFLGVASYGTQRGDVGDIFGAQFLNSGYSLPISGLAPGIYSLGIYGRSTVSGAFSAQRAVTIRVFSPSTPPPPAGELLFIDSPVSNSTVRGAVSIGGWAVDLRAANGSGVDQVDLWAYPNPGSGTLPILLGTAAYGATRADLAKAFSAHFAASGFSLTANLPAGIYDIAAFARSTVTGAFDRRRVTRITVQSPVMISIDTPTPNASVQGAFYIAGWSADLRSTSDSGIDAIHVWAYPNVGSGAAPVFLGPATLGFSRPDVRAAVGDAYGTSGYLLAVPVPALPPGLCDLVVFAHSSVTGVFENASVVRVTIK